MNLPYSRQTIGKDDIREVIKALRSPFLTQGPKIKEFEDAISKYTGAKFCVALNSGTAALHAAYAAAGVGEGDEVIVPAITFAATGNAALYLGAKPVFADIDLATGLVDINDIERKITKKTKVIVVVDFAGRPVDLDACAALAKKYGLLLIEDGAQSLGATYKGKSVGRKADMTMFSFHPVKSITTGEGGVITTNNPDFYEKLLMFRSHGLTRDPKRLREKKYGAWHQEMHMLGFNYRITDIQAALGVSQMKKLDSFIAKRRTRAEKYDLLFKEISGVVIPTKDSKNNKSAWHLYPIRIDGDGVKRDTVFAKMREKGIGVQVHYLPVYLHPYYQDLGYPKGLCPNAEIYSFSELSLPLFPDISIREQKYVVGTLEKILRSFDAK